MSYAEASPRYLAQGWTGVLPLKRGTKFPPPKGTTGRAGADPTTDQIDQWSQARFFRRGGIGLRLPVGVIGIDVDAYDGRTGAETLDEAQARWGVLPDTVWSTSRDDGVSGIRLYRAAGEFVGVLKFPELGIGDVDIIQHHHRYVVGWPSIHPEGRPYRWVAGGVEVGVPDPAGLPELPGSWLENLSTYSRAA